MHATRYGFTAPAAARSHLLSRSPAGTMDLSFSRAEACLTGSVLLLVLALAMGATAIWDLGGLATAVRARLEALPMLGASYKRLPSWALRAFGVWCFVFGVAQVIFVSAITHGT
jgi:hypothetical protein